MGSLFSSPASAGGEFDYSRHPISLIPTERFGRSLSSKHTLAASLGPDDHDGRLFTPEEVYAACICRLAHRALKHYNANNPGAEFEYPQESATTEMKAACVGFREHFLWYHLGFSARRRDNQETHLFFAELCYHIESPKITVQMCTILENPLCRFRSSCAFCPEESKILHPSEQEFVCGKEGQQTNFFRRRHMLVWPFETDVGNLKM
uniref:Uncharacterized protein n=1 Tax=Avena sativa TaxID=4498 RepID=A0ACD5UKG9_AVESA